METLAYLGISLFIIGGVGFLIAAFKESIWWGLLCILVSPISLVFLLLHWQEAKNAFFLQLAGLAIVMFAAYMGAELRNLAM